jgi:Fe2+ transport system protein FeoA
VECSALDGLPEDDRCLLTAMGLGERCEVRLCRRGHACIVQVDTTRLGIDEQVAARIMVTPIDDAS